MKKLIGSAESNEVHVILLTLSASHTFRDSAGADRDMTVVPVDLALPSKTKQCKTGDDLEHHHDNYDCHHYHNINRKHITTYTIPDASSQYFASPAGQLKSDHSGDAPTLDEEAAEWDVVRENNEHSAVVCDSYKEYDSDGDQSDLSVDVKLNHPPNPNLSDSNSGSTVDANFNSFSKPCSVSRLHVTPAAVTSVSIFTSDCVDKHHSETVTDNTKQVNKKEGAITEAVRVSTRLLDKHQSVSKAVSDSSRRYVRYHEPVSISRRTSPRKFPDSHEPVRIPEKNITRCHLDNPEPINALTKANKRHCSDSQDSELTNTGTYGVLGQQKGGALCELGQADQVKMAEAGVEWNLSLGLDDACGGEEGDEDVCVEDDGLVERADSPSSSMHRTPSQTDMKKAHDPYKSLERSQSDAALLGNAVDHVHEVTATRMMAAEASHSARNVSECNRVYLDLSRAEPYERVELADSTVGMFRSSSGRQLETIPQDEELKTGDLSRLYATRRSYSNDSSSSSLEDVGGHGKAKQSLKYSVVKTSTGKSQDSSIKMVGSKSQDNAKTKTHLKSSFQIYSHTLKQKVRTLQMGSVPEQINALEELNVLMEQAWSMPVYGKDLAYSLCDILSAEKALDIIISNLTSTNRDLLKASARLLEQSLTTSNRKQIAQCGLESVVKMTCDYRGDLELASVTTGILESLFKTSEETCSRVIKLGGLDVIIYWCRCSDRVILKHCAIALSNLALYGGPENQQAMTKHKAPEWLFPLAFVDDDSIRYYACLAIAVLVSNKEIEACVLRSGTLSLVLPFINAHDPQEFAVMDTSHQHGRSSGWLRRLVPVLSSKREEAQALAAFHMAMEAGIKAEQDRKEILYEIEAVDTLKWLASTPNSTASSLAGQALRILGEEVPHKLSQQVPLWTTEDVIQWVTQVGFGEYTERFRVCQVDGDLLLRLTENELLDSIEIGCAITRKRFLRELRDLKISADYTSCDPTKLGDWLVGVGPVFSQYTYQMIQCGVDKQTLCSLTHDHLSQDCAIINGIHRMKILGKIEELRNAVSSPTTALCDCVDEGSGKTGSKPIDVFISYRRSNGSQLASLLKVHLQLRGFTVFIDIERLRAGKFDEGLLESVRQANSFIIVLTPNALDRCMDDEDKNDWVHKEIAAAIEGGLNIIPLFDNFHWPPAEKLPADMRNLSFFNGVRWIHDYQDACVDKLESFLRGDGRSLQYNGPQSASSCGSCDSPSSPQSSNQHSPPKAADKKLFEGPSYSQCCANSS